MRHALSALALTCMLTGCCASKLSTVDDSHALAGLRADLHAPADTDFTSSGNGFPGPCHLPVSVALELHPSGETARAEIRGRMPNFLPADWDQKCGSPSSAQSR